MKPDQVTGAMVEKFETLADIGDGFSDEEKKEIIAAAYNAVVASDEPITAEWLETIGFAKKEGSLRITYDDCQLCWYGENHLSLMDGDYVVFFFPATSRRQLLALLAGLGIEVRK